MPAKRCLILAAGFGTRMGAIGKKLPKVMWPVFEMSLLELQIRFARNLGYGEIYVNLHHQADEILSRAKKSSAFDGVQWLLETPEILDIGGGIHNLASQKHINYQGELLVLNSDQFLWFTAGDLEKWKSSSDAWDAILLTWGVNSSQGYNQVKTDDNKRFTGVIPNAQLPRDMQMETYSGNSLINLSTLDRTSGPSSFFDSVAPAKRRVMTARLRDGRYWDFGTATRYYDSMRAILESVSQGSRDEFVTFLLAQNGFLPNKLDSSRRSYGCHVPGLIHLGDGEAPLGHPSGIVLQGLACASGTEPVLVYDGEVQLLG